MTRQHLYEILEIIVSMGSSQLTNVLGSAENWHVSKSTVGLAKVFLPKVLSDLVHSDEKKM